MNIKILAIDMDGTTLNSHNTLSAGNCNALQRAVDAGVLVVPATGRQYSGLPPEISAVHGLRYYLCSNGAVVYDQAKQTILHEDLMQRDVALRVLAELARWSSAENDVYTDGRAYTNQERYAHPEQHGVNHIHVKTFLASRTPVDSLSTFVSRSDKCPEKIFSMFSSMEERQACWNTLSTWPEIALTTSFPLAIEVNNKTATKGDGLSVLAQLLHIPQEAVMAVGDGPNDTTMLDWAGVSVAMGNADPEVSRHAAYQTGTCDSDGLAQAIDRFVFQ